MRYEQLSTVIAANVGIGGRGKVFGDDVAASVIAGRACHHCYAIKINSRSHRPKGLTCEGTDGG